ncbi:PBECR2 nuclease fold domain-containing protein, partial [Campylobacter felis]|uniref:PBECR3 domain-containing polyvalent protein n=1 Tax=Campylobacter felis TaxID=2974565 RepID=UPI00255D77E2|nr:PBECR2 nuclease fold domain-containing protein [Campylobacter felis]
IKLERELKRTNFNSNTSRLIEKFMDNLEAFNAEKEAKIAKIREEELKRQEAFYKKRNDKNDEFIDVEVLEEVGLNEPMKFLEFQQKKLLTYIKQNTPLRLLEHKKEFSTRDILNFLEQSSLNGKEKAFLIRHLERDLDKIKAKIEEEEALKETQKAWLKTFGLKSMDEAYTPKFSKEVSEALEPVLKGEEIKLTKGSFEKLLKRDREEFLPVIKETLENADAVLKDKENALIFVKDIGKKSYFTSVAKNANNEWVISTNSLKTLNTLKNRVDDNGEVLFLSKEASNILAEAFTKRAFSNELANDIIPQAKQTKLESTLNNDTLQSYRTHNNAKILLDRNIWEKELELKKLVEEKEKVERVAQTIKEQANSRTLTKIARELEKIGFESFSKRSVMDYEESKLRKINPRLTGQQFYDESTIIDFKDLKKFIKSRDDFIKFKDKLDTLHLEKSYYSSIWFNKTIKDFSDTEQARFYQIFNEDNYDKIMKELVDEQERKVKNIDNDKIISLQKELGELKEQLEKTNQSLEQSERELEQFPFLQKLVNHKPLFDDFLALRFTTMSEKEIKKQAKEAFIDIDISRGYIEKSLNITPLKEFGTNYAEFYRDGKGAIEKLIREAGAFKENGEKGEYKGQVSGAFYKEGLGDIDVVWGDESFGLKHILERRTQDFINQGFKQNEAQNKTKELLNEIPQILENGKIYSQNKDKIEIITDKYTLVIGTRNEKKFIITELIDRRNKKRMEAMQTVVGDSFTDEPLAKTPLSSNQESIIAQINDTLSEVVDNYEHFCQRYGGSLDGSLYLDDFKALSKDEQREFSHILYTFRNYLNQYDKSFENATDSIKKAYELDILGQKEANDILKKANPQRNITKYVENALRVIKSIKASKEYGDDYFEKMQELKDIENKFYKYITGLEKTKNQIENIQFQIQKANLEKLNELNERVDESVKNLIDKSTSKGRDMQIIGAANFTPQIAKYIHENKKRIAIEKLDAKEAENLGFKFPNEARATIDYTAIQHTLKRHGGDSKLAKESGQEPINYDDIANYRNIAKNADETLQSEDKSGNKVVVSFKQINGHFVVVEQMQRKNNDLAFKTMFKEKGEYKNSPSYKETRAKTQTLSSGYEPSANSFVKPDESIPQTPQEIIKQAKQSGKSVTETKELLQKHKDNKIINTLKEMQDKDVNVKLGDKDLLELYARASKDIVKNMENARFEPDFIHQIKQYNDNL